MMRARKVTGLTARGAAVAAVLAIAATPSQGLAQTVADAAPPQSQAPAPTGISESVAALVNDDIISTFDLAQRMRLLIATSGVQPTAQNLPQIQQQALMSLVDERLQLQELRRMEREQNMSIVATDADVTEELGEMAQGNNMSLDQFTAMLRGQGILGSLREQIRAQISWQRLIRGRYGSRLRIGEDQITAAQQRMEAAASRPQYQIGEVFIDAARVGGMETAMQGAQQLVAQMQQGAPFQAVARQFSASPTAASGGDVGWVAAGEMPPEVDQALEAMRPGQLSQPIPVRDGVYIVYLRDKRTGAGGTLVHLKQAAVPLPPEASEAQVADARATLERIRANTSSCEALEATAGAVEGVMAGDLGEAEVEDLAPAFREAAQQLQPGELSGPIRTSAGLHLVAVCGKRPGGASAISREQVENRLFGQQLSMIARRYMRDLRTSATIETR